MNIAAASDSQKEQIDGLEWELNLGELLLDDLDVLIDVLVLRVDDLLV
jgi:hypothetical protein